MKDNLNTVQFMETTFMLPCDMYGCYHTAKYDIGKPVDLSNRIRLCESCYHELLKSVPVEETEVTREIALGTLEEFVKQDLVSLGELKELVELLEIVDSVDPENVLQQTIDGDGDDLSDASITEARILSVKAEDIGVDMLGTNDMKITGATINAKEIHSPYEGFTLNQLREFARNEGVTGFSRMNKTELIEALTDSRVDKLMDSNE